MHETLVKIISEINKLGCLSADEELNVKEILYTVYLLLTMNTDVFMEALVRDLVNTIFRKITKL